MDDDEEEEEEDMFNLDEEFSDEEEKEEIDSTDKQEESSEEQKDVKNDKDILLSSSLQKSISEIDQKFSWIKKKRNTSKYIRKDFDLKKDVTTATASNNEIDNQVSLYATSVPITIHYSLLEDDEDNEEEKEDEARSRKKDNMLASSFVNYDFSYSDRLLSEQFPRPARRKSVASNSLIRPQLDSLVGKSLDTRGLMKKKRNEQKSKDYYDGIVSSSPPAFK